MRNVLFCIFGLGIGLASTLPAEAQTTSNTYSKKGASAELSITNITNDACNYSDFFHAEAAESVEKTDITRTVTRSAEVSWGGRDECAQVTWGGSATIPLKKEAFSTANTVTFSFDVPVQYGYYETDQTVIRHLVGTITFTLDPTGTTEKTKTVTTISNDFFALVSRSKGTMTDANVAINASIVGAPPFPYQTGYGSIGNTKEGSYTITHFQ